MDDMYDIAIALIREYKERKLGLNGFMRFAIWFWKDESRLQKRLYSRWAADEILFRLMDHCFGLPENRILYSIFDDIDDFILQLLYFQKIRDDNGIKIAIKTAEDIKNYLKIKLI